MMNELRPPALIRFGLGKTIQNHVEDLLERHPAIAIDLELDENEAEQRLPEKVSLTLFRIYQEAITNATRHANATQISVRFSIRQDLAHLEIQDNGCGFPVPEDWGAQAQTGHYGLPGMRERADTVGGVFSVTSEPGSGTKIVVEVPVIEHRG